MFISISQLERKYILVERKRDNVNQLRSDLTVIASRYLLDLLLHDLGQMHIELFHQHVCGGIVQHLALLVIPHEHIRIPVGGHGHGRPDGDTHFAC